MINAAQTIDRQSVKTSPLEIFRERAEARCLLIHNGLMDWHDGIDELWAAADRAGLVKAFGADEIQRVLAESFARRRLE